jgi:SAM-dependent methyltransferase
MVRSSAKIALMTTPPLTNGLKQLFYMLCGPAMKANGWLHRHMHTRNAGLHVQLGPGKKKYIPDWVNVDANIFTSKCDIWADLRNPLPFASNTVAAMYSHHVIEHLPDLRYHFDEVFRCLQPGGVYRVGGPNGDSAIRKFAEGDHKWFFDYPDSRTSIGGRFENFIFCRQEHLTILTYSFLEELMISSGFANIKCCAPIKESSYPEVFSVCMANEWESDYDYPHTLIVEAVKPIP